MTNISASCQNIISINLGVANMQPDQSDPHTLCTKCNVFVRTANFLIHEARCKGPSSASQMRPSSSISRSNSSRIFPSRYNSPSIS